MNFLSDSILILFIFRILDKDPFEMEDEEYEAEIEDDSVRSSESDGKFLPSISSIFSFLLLNS